MIMNSIIDNGFALCSPSQALDLQGVFTLEANQECATTLLNDGNALFVTSKNEGSVDSSEAMKKEGYTSGDIDIRIHSHPGKNAKDGSTSEGTRGGSLVDVNNAKSKRNAIIC